MLCKADILERTNQGLDVFRYYIPGNWTVAKNFKNPFYEDTRASFNIYWDKRRNLYQMKDFGNDDYSGDCFVLVGIILGLNSTNTYHFIEIMKQINHDLNLGLDGSTHQPREYKKQPIAKVAEAIPDEKRSGTQYKFTKKAFTQDELEFWDMYDITPHILEKFSVFSIKQFKGENRQGKEYVINGTIEYPVFAYYGYGNYIKLYLPYSKNRFLYGGVKPDNYVFGLEQLPHKGDILFITGGEKDVMSLYAKGFHAICFNSETSHIPRELLETLKLRFRHIILLYDVDETGKKASAKHQEEFRDLPLLSLELPIEGDEYRKDISDYFESGYDAEEFRILVLELIENIYQKTMQMVKSCEIDFSNPPPESEHIVTINNVPLATTGNLFCITGSEGTGKSHFASAIVAGALQDTDSIGIDTLGLNISHNKQEKAVLLYDTEQSESQLYKNIASTIKRARLMQMPDYFKAFYLATMSRKERLESIRNTMDLYYHRYRGIKVVIIDGIADLVRSSNDEIESINLIDELYRLASIYNTCIVGVLHFIPNGLKLRGHLGSEMQRKSAGIVSIEQENNSELSTIKALKVREGSPLDVPLVQFAWDKKIGMHTYRGNKSKEDKDRRKKSELKAVAKEIFSSNGLLTYQDLAKEIESVMEVAGRTAKSYIAYMREKGIIIKDPTNLNHYILGAL